MLDTQPSKLDIIQPYFISHQSNYELPQYWARAARRAMVTRHHAQESMGWYRHYTVVNIDAD